MIKIKICGLKSIKDIKIVNKYHPEYVGFIFANSKRQIDDKTALNLKKELDYSIQAVGVFVNEPMENIIQLCQDQIIDVIQLHGDEDLEYINLLKSKLSNPVIKAVRVNDEIKSLPVNKYSADYLLYDTAVKGNFGGSGIAFDHCILTKEQSPFFLAGGLNEVNVVSAISVCNPFCVDVSSGVETDGIKDEIKIRNFINAVRER